MCGPCTSLETTPIGRIALPPSNGYQIFLANFLVLESAALFRQQRKACLGHLLKKRRRYTSQTLFKNWREVMVMASKYTNRPGLSRADTGIRKVASTFGKAAFLTHAQKADGMRAVESDTERFVANILGFEPSVRSFAPQPFTVDLIAGTILHTPEQRAAARAKHNGITGPKFYTPDFALSMSDGTREALEVKLDAFPGDSKYDEVLSAASQILWDHGYKFSKVVFPNYWQHPLRVNVPLIHQARMRNDLCLSEATFELIEQLFKAGARTASDYCAGMSISARMLPVLVAFGALEIDIVNFQIRGDAPAKPAYGGLDHLEVVRRLTR